MRYKVVLLKNLAETGKAYLSDNDCEVVVSQGTTEEEFIEDMKGCHGLFVRNELVTASMMDACPSLKVIAKHGTGYDNIDTKAAKERGVRVVYAPLGNVNSVSEHCFMLILNCAKRYGIVKDALNDDNYNIRYVLSDAVEVKGKVLGLIGCGNIAKELAKKAHFGFGMKVIAYSPRKKEGLEKYGIEYTDNRDKVFRMADFLSIHVPSTEETRKSIGILEFQKMKETAYLINTARGDIVNEDDLIEALEKGLIKGAGLDVYEKEPIHSNHKLLNMSQVITTPHTAGMTIEASNSLSLMGARGIVDVLNGKEPEWPVI